MLMFIGCIGQGTYRLVVFLITELLAAMPNHNMDNNKFTEVEVWFVQPTLELLLLLLFRALRDQLLLFGIGTGTQPFLVPLMGLGLK